MGDLARVGFWKKIVLLTLLVYSSNKDQESFCFIRMVDLDLAFTCPFGPSWFIFMPKRVLGQEEFM